MNPLEHIRRVSAKPHGNMFFNRKVARERLKYGVSSTDTWNFDSYLLDVLANGLQMLAEGANGAPVGTEYFAWVCELKNQAANARWIQFEYSDLEDEILDKYRDSLSDTEWFDYLLEHGTNPPETRSKEIIDAERKAFKELYVEKDRRKDELMDFVKKYFFTLWD
jgi:hypothetical protein